MNIGFVAAVAEMRALQKTWFKTKPEDRPPDLLRQCKEAERQVDKAVERYTNPETFLFEK